ncbi:hypothetical protein GCK32_014211, partial [Trichostrongylus colubriformis]
MSVISRELFIFPTKFKVLSIPSLLQERNENLEAYANIATANCSGVNMTPPGGSMNIYTTTLPMELPSDTMITIALSAWMSEMNLTPGPDVSSAQQNFVNMIYYKSTQVGCSYQKCDAGGGLYFYTIACAFDQSIQKGGKPYEASEKTGCTRSKCQKVYSDATCSQDTGLCGRPVPTTTASSPTSTPQPSESLKKCEFYYALQRINAYRAAVANGVMPIPGGELPGCTTMFALDCDPSLELLAKFTVQDCQPKNLTLPGNPLNFFWISRLPKDQEEKDVIDMALATWMSQINVNGTKAREYKN